MTKEGIIHSNPGLDLADTASRQVVQYFPGKSDYNTGYFFIDGCEKNLAITGRTLPWLTERFVLQHDKARSLSGKLSMSRHDFAKHFQ